MRLWGLYLRSFDRVGGIISAVLLATPALIPLMSPGMFDSHDGVLHLYRLAALDNAIHSGILYPRLFPDLAYGYGFPVLNYYSPISYYVAEVFHLLGAGFIDATKLTYGAGFLLSAVTMYVFARGHFPRIPAILASVVYVYAPYHIADGYLRGALAELLAFIFMPAILWAVRRTILFKSPVYAIVTGLLLALLVLTHNLSLMLFGPVFVAYIGYNVASIRDSRPLPLVVLSIAFGSLLSAFYWLPAIAEMPFVLLGTESENFGYRGHLAESLDLFSPFINYRYFPNQGVGHEYPLGLVYLGIIILGALGLIVLTAKQGKHYRQLYAFFGAIFLVAAFLTLTLSNPLWEAIRPLRYLQYPWRLQAITALAGAPMAAYAVLGLTALVPPRLPAKLGSILLVFVITGALAYTSLAELPTHPLPVNDNDITTAKTMQFDFSVRQIGTTWSAEYLPLTVKEDRSVIGLATSREEERPSLDVDLASFKLIESAHLSTSFSLRSNKVSNLSLHAFDFPGWSAYIDGEPAEVFPTTSLGLVTVAVPAGEHQVTVRFEDTPVRRAGLLATALALVSIPLILASRRKWRFAAATTFVIALTIGLGLWLPNSFKPNVPVNQVSYSFGEIGLLGYKLNKSDFKPGDKIEVVLDWLSLRQTDENYSVYIHLVDKANRAIWGQHDGQPGYGFSPTSRWVPGEIVPDVHQILVPSGIREGDYELRVGIYEQSTMKNLAVMDVSTGADVGAVYLGKLRVTDD